MKMIRELFFNILCAVVAVTVTADSVTQSDTVHDSAGYLEIRSGNVNVVVAENAPQTVLFAASEMTNYLSRVIGAAVPISVMPDKRMVNIFLGENEWSRIESLDPKPIVRDGFLTCVKEKSIFLLGVDDLKIDPYDCFTGDANLLTFERGTLHAVYDFLERYADVRFFFPGELGTVVPRKGVIRVTKGVRRVEPVFTERYYGWWNTDKDGWYDKSKSVREVTARHWLQLRYGSSRKQCCHGLRHFQYVRRYAKNYSEWFCLREDGRRHLEDGTPPHFGNGSKFCYTSPIREEIYQDVKAFLLGKPSSSRGLARWGDNCVSQRSGNYVDIMPEDGFMKCMCQKCLSAYNKNMRAYATDLIWGLTAEIATRLKNENVAGGVTQMAYFPFDGVPSFGLPDNIQVMLAVSGPFGTSTPEIHAAQMKKLQEWTDKLGHKVWIWTYPGKPRLSGRMTGVPEIAPRAYAKFFKEAAPYIIGGYLDNSTDRFMFQVLNLYVFSKLAWDPKLDVDMIIEEWNSRLFGTAKEEMKSIYEILEKKWIENVCKGRVVESALGPLTVKPTAGQLWSMIYDMTTMNELIGLFDAAEAKTAPKSIEAQRVALLRRELLDSLLSQSVAADPSTELRRRAEMRCSQNLISNGDFATLRGWKNSSKWGGIALDPSSKVTGGFSLRLDSDKVPHEESNVQCSAITSIGLRKGRTYRLSYFIKTKNVVPYRKFWYSLGAGLCLWYEGGKYEKHPLPLLTGDSGWMHQCHVFSPPADSPSAKLQFRLEHSLGTMWVDGVLLEDITENKNGGKK